MSTPIPLPLLDGDTLLLDNSSMENHQTCPRQAQYAICLRRKTAGPSSALKFGGIAHQVLETRYRSAAAMSAQTAEVEAGMRTVAQGEFHGKVVNGVHVPGWTPPEDDFRTFDCMSNLITKYGERYPFEDFDIVKLPDGRPFVEVPFAFPLCEITINTNMCVQRLRRDEKGDFVKDGSPIQRFVGTIKVLWIGKIDLAYQSHGGLYVMDHKTSSIATNMAEFEISHQFYGYTTAVEDMLGTQVSGIVINRMTCRKPTRTGEAYTFERKLIPVQRGLVTEWRTDCIAMVTNFVNMVRDQYMPKHTSWCVGKFGTCQFHKVCTLDSPEQREMMLGSGEFEDNVWSPLKS